MALGTVKKVSILSCQHTTTPMGSPARRRRAKVSCTPPPSSTTHTHTNTLGGTWGTGFDHLRRKNLSLPQCVPSLSSSLVPFHINKSLVFDFLEPTWTFMRRCAGNLKAGLGYHPLLLTEINCGSPGILPNGWLEGQKTTLHAVVTFRCQEGMTFEGPSYRTICLADGRWSHPLPRCYGR